MKTLAAWLAVLLVATAARNESVAGGPGPTVEEVRFESTARIDARDFQAHCPLRAGEGFSEDRVAESIRWFERKETFRSIEAVVEMRGERAVVTFHLDPMPFVVDVEVVGAKALDAETILRSARIREDEPLSSVKTAAAEQRLVKLYRDRGYPEAEAAVELEEDAPGQVAVTIRVREGRAHRLRSVVVHGMETAAVDERALGLPFHVGDVVAEDTLGRGRAALLRLARSRGFYEAEVDARSDDLPDGGVEIRYDVLLGPRFEVSIIGNQALSSADLLGLIDLSARPIITAGTWKLMAVRMRERYQDDGFRFAEVTVSTSGSDPTRIRFSVDEGPQVHVAEIRFVGNESMSAAALLAAMTTRPREAWRAARWWARWTRGGDDRLREAALAEDVERVAAAYREEGYSAVQVVEGPRAYSADRQNVVLVLEIREGDRRVVESVDIAAVEDVLPHPERGLRARVGSPLRSEDIERDRQTLVRRLGRRGFVDAVVTADVNEGSPAAGTVPVRIGYRPVPGQQVRIGNVIIQQNYFTRDYVVRRALRFDTGEVLDPEDLSSGQSDLYRLGIFRSVSIQPEETTGASRDVRVRVAERPGGELQYGLGYDTRAGVHSFLQVGHRNIAGTGDQLTLRGDLNLAPDDLVPDEYIASLEGKQPHVLGTRYDLTGHVARQQSERSIDEFSIRETSTSLGLEREIVRGLRVSLLGEFQDSDVYDVKPDAVLTGRDVGRLRIVSLNPIVLYDGRDDLFAPTRGVFDSLRLRYSTPRFGSDVDFVKIDAQHSQYVPLAPGFTFIYAVRVGWALPLGDSDAIPLSERFFLGGRTTVRGYDENEIGPTGEDGNPIGGDLRLNVQTELRFPLLYGVLGAVFLDGGGLYLQDRSISSHDFREGVGPGLRYQTPVGSISLDYGFKIRRRADESIGEIHFTIGNIF